MIQAYSIGISVPANSSVPFNNVNPKKGNTVELVGAGTIQFNKKGIYMVSVDASSAASVELQLMRDGVLLPQAQSTGLNPSFLTLIQVPQDNTCCCATTPVSCQLVNVGTAAAALDNVNLVVTKIC